MSLAFYFCIIGYKPIGSILGIIDSAGQLMVKYKYTAYGKVTVTKDTDGLADSISFANNAVDSGGNFSVCRQAFPSQQLLRNDPAKNQCQND